MLFLKKIGFGYLGNIHLGNIYLIKSANAEEDVSANAAKDVCQISGHENTLFGYRTGIFEEVVRKPEFLKYMDVIMFGKSPTYSLSRKYWSSLLGTMYTVSYKSHLRT